MAGGYHTHSSVRPGLEEAKEAGTPGGRCKPSHTEQNETGPCARGLRFGGKTVHGVQVVNHGAGGPALALPDLPSSLCQSQVLSSQVGCTLWVPVCRAQALLYKKASGSPSGSPRRQMGLQVWNLAVMVHRALALTCGWERGGGQSGGGGWRGRPVAPIHPPSLP